MEMTELMPKLALVANERCGSWYIDRTKKKAYSGYFKSTDGHMHIWDFNIRRNNLHLLPIILEHGGCMIVDSTRKGKRIPDALSKTIPIWCCTINRAVHRHRLSQGIKQDEKDWDMAFHSLPTAVSRSEHAQIEAKLDGFVQRLLDSGIDMEVVSNGLVKPLRPIWFTPQSYDAVVESPPDFDDAPFCPVVCLSASEAVETGCQSRPGYLYVQGSGDDQEAWALGLTHIMFWKNHLDILSNQAECEEKVKCIVAANKDALMEEGEADGKNFAMVQPTMLGIGNYASGKPPYCWENFDYIINCSVLEYEGMDSSKYLHLPIPDGKKGQIIFGASIQKAIEFVHDPIMENKRILVHCSTGKDYSVGILTSILIHYYDLNGQLLTSAKPRVDKKTVQHQLVRIISNWEKASPSRVTLKRVNTHFMSHSG
ncbi:initiator tRNA phosphoribosyl transferase [Mucor mucedo]|uniref:initiator tRNA phosphoribosyl transferase n=1 Tax=Mucor mucedo TaxID=29922 RepID=UPI00221F29BD|nr:initiator tRNA phosphoribosyl transferase [Mucor mucedo]KAI7869092.1 initiator tRNA phosphoribosyl transferase [Mucor mucedo]